MPRHRKRKKEKPPMGWFNREDRLSRIENQNFYILRRQGETLRMLHHIAAMEAIMVSKLEQWEKALQADTDATNAVETAINKLIEDVRAGGFNDPKLDAILAGFEANSARTAALALAGTPADPGTPIPDPVVVPVEPPPA